MKATEPIRQWEPEAALSSWWTATIGGLSWIGLIRPKRTNERTNVEMLSIQWGNKFDLLSVNVFKFFLTFAWPNFCSQRDFTIAVITEWTNILWSQFRFDISASILMHCFDAPWDELKHCNEVNTSESISYDTHTQRRSCASHQLRQKLVNEKNKSNGSDLRSFATLARWFNF